MSAIIHQPKTLDIQNVERDSKDTEYEVKLECLDTSKGLPYHYFNMPQMPYDLLRRIPLPRHFPPP